jgi:hypothetical protein
MSADHVARMRRQTPQARLGAECLPAATPVAEGDVAALSQVEFLEAGGLNGREGGGACRPLDDVVRERVVALRAPIAGGTKPGAPPRRVG